MRFGTFLAHKSRKIVIGSCIALLALVLGFYSSTSVAHASGSGAVLYVHTATSTNTVGSSTRLDATNLNGNPNAIIIVTPDWNPYGYGGTYDNHPIGTYYSGGYWYINNEDGASILGMAFNIYGVPGPVDYSYEGAFVHTATASNISGSVTYLTDTANLGNAFMRVLVTHNSTNGYSDDHPLGVYYNISLDEWAVFNEDGAAMTAGETFNVNFANDTVGSVLVQTATSANTVGNYTCIDDPNANSNPKALVEITSNWNPGGSGGVYNNHYTGVWYNTSNSRWCIFNQDHASILNASFNVYIF